MNETGPGDSKEDVKWLDDQLGEPFHPDQQDEPGEEPLAHAGGACSSTSSAQKPGPIAISSP